MAPELLEARKSGKHMDVLLGPERCPSKGVRSQVQIPGAQRTHIAGEQLEVQEASKAQPSAGWQEVPPRQHPERI